MIPIIISLVLELIISLAIPIYYIVAHYMETQLDTPGVVILLFSYATIYGLVLVIQYHCWLEKDRSEDDYQVFIIPSDMSFLRGTHVIISLAFSVSCAIELDENMTKMENILIWSICTDFLFSAMLPFILHMICLFFCKKRRQTALEQRQILLGQKLRKERQRKAWLSKFVA